jgi:hypothetical protein
MKSPRGWKRPLDEPIPLPRGAPLVTLQDAGTYITKPPKAEHEAAEWQAAMEALILVATHGRPDDVCSHSFQSVTFSNGRLNEQSNESIFSQLIKNKLHLAPFMRLSSRQFSHYVV